MVDKVDTSGAELLLALVYGESISFIRDLIPGGVAASAIVLAELTKAGKVSDVFLDEDDTTVLLAVDDPSATMDRMANRVLHTLTSGDYLVSEALVHSTPAVFDASRGVEDSIKRARQGIADVIKGKRAGSYAELSVLSVVASIHDPSKELFGIVSGMSYNKEIAEGLYRSHVWSGLEDGRTSTVNTILANLFDVTANR